MSSPKHKKVAKDFGYKEKVLNYTAHRHHLTRPNKVGPVMELIRVCEPTEFDDWVRYYFQHAETKTTVPVKVDDDLLKAIGERLYELIHGVVIPEWTKAFQEITIEDCVEYIREVTLHRTYDGYIREKSAVHDNLAKVFTDVKFEESDSELDHAGNVDYIGRVGKFAFGLQIKPITANSQMSLGRSYRQLMEQSFESFEESYGGKVFVVLSEKEKIVNKEVEDEIRKEIERLRGLS